jgi:hypothetical protein
VAAFERASEINEAEGKFLIELAQHIDRYGDVEGGDFALERTVSMGSGLSHHLMWATDNCSILHTGVASFASFLASVLSKVPLFNVCSCQKILKRNGDVATYI